MLNSITSVIASCQTEMRSSYYSQSFVVIFHDLVRVDNRIRTLGENELTFLGLCQITLFQHFLHQIPGNFALLVLFLHLHELFFEGSNAISRRTYLLHVLMIELIFKLLLLVLILHFSLRASSFAAWFQEVCTTTFACYRWDAGQYIRLTMVSKVDDTYWICWPSLWMHVRFQDLARWLSSSFQQSCHCGSWSDCVPTIWRVLA